MRFSLVLPISIAAVVSACSASSDPGTAATDQAEAAPPTATPTSAPDAEPAESVVRVVTAGTFVSPDFGQLDSVAGSGTAFIVDESGLAVTNNHVVAGAASIEVFFDDADEPIAATVVGNAECADLAVIDLAGEGYSPLGWSGDEASAGLGIQALGYPDGEPGLTLTGGIVARVDSDGATPWASIPSLLRHDADLAPGNSGGPILDDDNNVVGVNVAASDSGRFAIPASVAEPIVEQLTSGTDVDSIGLNAVAVLDDVTNESGVWVVSVEAGSPAAAAGVLPGDVITRMKGVRVGQDATLADYCAVVRSAGDGELPIEVTRNGEFLAGSVRGSGGLSRVLAVTDDVVDTATAPPSTVIEPPPAGTPYDAFVNVTDDSGVISFDVPAAWSDVRTGPVSLGGADRPAISATYDFEASQAATGTTYDQPGVYATVFSAEVDINEAFGVLMDNLPWQYDCTPLAREPFSDNVFEGVMQPFMDCADTGSTVFSIGMRRAGEPGWILINIFAPTVADLDAAVRIANTYTFEGLPVDPVSEPVEEPEALPDEPETTLEPAPLGTSPTDQLPETLSATVGVGETIGAPPGAGTSMTPSETLFSLRDPTTETADQDRVRIERLFATGVAGQ